jgi:hypothetical protein
MILHALKCFDMLQFFLNDWNAAKFEEVGGEAGIYV